MKNLIFLIVVVLFISINQKGQAQVITGQEKQARRDTVTVHLKKAQSLTMQGKTEEATKICIGIMESDPNNREAVQGWLMANMKRTPTGEEEAIKQLEDLEKLYPNNSGILFFKAFIEAEHGRNEDALKDLDKLINIQPDTAVNYILKGQTLYAMEKYKEASDAFDRAVTLDPKRQDVWGMKAGALAKISKFDEAITSINKGLELAPNNAVNVYNRACIYCLKGDKVNALADLKRAISLNPSFRESARKDDDFRSLYEDEDFKKLTL
jgi:predicted Zn-dependent protease